MGIGPTFLLYESSVLPLNYVGLFNQTLSKIKTTIHCLTFIFKVVLYKKLINALYLTLKKIKMGTNTDFRDKIDLSKLSTPFSILLIIIILIISIQKENKRISDPTSQIEIVK